MSKSNFIVRGGYDANNITKGLAKTQKQLGDFQNKVNKSMKVVGTIIGSLAIGKLVKDSTAMAMSVESAIDNISRNMGKSSAAFNNWVETQSKGLGMARAEAYKYGSTFSNLLSSFSNGAKETADNTQELMKAAAIISSKTGRSYDDTANRIRSGMLGSTEAIEDLGVYTNVSMIESTKAFKKFAGNKSWAQLDFQTQQQIRLAAILEQTYARYGDTLADTTMTRQAMFVASLRDIQLNLGQAFLPIYNAVLPLLTALSNKLVKVTNTLKYFTQALFGKATVGPVAQTEEQASSISSLGDAAEQTGEQTQKAGKEIKGAVAGFDEINTLADKTAGSMGGIGDSLAVGAPSAVTEEEVGKDTEVSPAIQKAVEKLKSLIEPLKSINLDNLKNALKNLAEATKPLTETLFKGLEWAVRNVFVPLAKITIEYVIPAFLNALALAMKGLNAVLEKAKPLIIGTAIAFGSWKLIEFANYVKYIGALTNTTGFLALFNAVRQLAFVGFAGLKTQAVGAIGALKTLAATMLLAAKNAGLLLIEMGKQIAIMIKTAAQWVINKTVMIASTAAQLAMNAATAIWNTIGAIAAAVTTAFGVAVGILTSPIGLVVLAIAALVAGIILLINNWDTVKTTAKTVWDSITEVWGKASGWFDENVLTPIKNGFKGAINFLIGLAEGFANGFIKGINAIINALNKLSFKNPLTGEKIGVNINQVKEIKIPRLAKGGITSGPTLAMIGDNPGGKEVVSPLDDLVDIIASAVGSAVMGAMQFGSSNNDNRDLIVNFNGREFARAALKDFSNESVRLGFKPILQNR